MEDASTIAARMSMNLITLMVRVEISVQTLRNLLGIHIQNSVKFVLSISIVLKDIVTTAARMIIH